MIDQFDLPLKLYDQTAEILSSKVSVETEGRNILRIEDVWPI